LVELFLFPTVCGVNAFESHHQIGCFQILRFQGSNDGVIVRPQGSEPIVLKQEEVIFLGSAVILVT
jgi:hypothetical protein